jgi:threonylcarbamoyladenosine tRNA methylthiotransferase MtaB
VQVHLKTLGCRLNEAELEHWATGFISKGHVITQTPEQADVVVINTCAVTQDAVRKSRQLIRRTHRNNPTAKLVVSGCYSSLNKTISDEIEGIDLVVPNQDKENLVELAVHELNMLAMPSEATTPGETSLFKRGRQRAFIKIQDGCRYRCTYCIVTVARGSERSRTIGDIVSEINNLTRQGIHEAVLTGVHVGGYGSDINCDLYDLIKTILSETDLPRLRLASVEPWDLPDKFFELFSNPRLMPHMHLPLQSGSDSVLKRMSRRCKTSDFKHLIDTARSEVPDFNVTTDIIVGFPGETEEEWQESIDFISDVEFSHIHIFSYSEREGTKAAGLPNQISNDVKKSRSVQLHQLAAEMKKSYLEKHIHREFQVLWEGSSPTDQENITRYFGYTPNFVRTQIEVQSDVVLTNQIHEAKINSVNVNGENVLGVLI